MTTTRVVVCAAESFMCSRPPWPLSGGRRYHRAPRRPGLRGGGTVRFLGPLEVDVSPRALKNLVGGAASDAADGATLDVVDPSTGEVFATAPLSGAADVDAACQTAATAFETWRDTTPSDRQRALLTFADLVEANADELVALESENTGKPIGLTSE